MNERELLEQLVKALNQYNQSDMLDGYLNDFGPAFNEDLKSLGLPIIEEVNGGEDDE